MEEKKTKVSAEKAAEMKILIDEDIRKYELAKANLRVEIAKYDAAIEECRLALADITRQEAGVEYPEPKAPDAGTGAMSAPVGGPADPSPAK